MKQLRENLNFSLWCDFLERDFLDNGFLELLKNQTVNGVTSNPAIFKDAILNSQAYKKDIKASKEVANKHMRYNQKTDDCTMQKWHHNCL